MLRRVAVALRTPAARRIPAAAAPAAIRRAAYASAPAEIHQGPGAAPGTIPTDLDQATGLERLEILAEQEGRVLWDMSPLDMTHMGTKENPIVIKTVDPERLVGCSGYPAEAHETVWLAVQHGHAHDRCPECGCVYKYEYVGEGAGPELHH